jgi:hypothetical protein
LKWIVIISKDTQFRKLDESIDLLVGNLFEDAYLLNKRSNEEIYLGSFYGDPSFGLISTDGTWSIVGGEYVIIWHSNGKIIPLDDESFKWVVAVRQSAPLQVELLVEQTADLLCVRALDIETLEVVDLRTINNESNETLDNIQW